MTTTLKRVIGRLLGTGSYVVLTVLLAGCGGGTDQTAPAVAAPTTAATTAQTMAPCTAAVEPLGSAARRALRIYYRPGGRPGERFGKLNPNGVPTVFGVVARRIEDDCEPSWYRVRLPRRPNRRLAWVRAADVTVGEVRTRILVD